MALSRKNIWENLPLALRSTAGALLSLVPMPYLLGRRFRTALAFVRSSERWSAEQARAHQLRQVRGICKLAEARSPFYRKWFRDAGLCADDLRSLCDLGALPLIDKETVRSAGREMCCLSPDSAGVDYVTTGGSGGVPLGFFIGADRSSVEYAHLVAGWERARYALHLPQAVLRGQIVAPDRAGFRHEYDRVLRRHYYSSFHLTDGNMGRYLAHIATLGSCFLHVYPSTVSALVRFIRRTGAPVPKNIRGILAGSESVYPEDRARAEEVFGVRYFSWYGHSEKLVCAAECEHSTDYHVWPTYGLLELVDDDGRPITVPGGRGEIVGTGFMNRVMPFIRYRTGDRATYVADECSHCGRQQVLLRDIAGHRTQEVLIARDGSEIPWTAVNMHDDTFQGVRQFQFRQDRPGCAVLRVVPAGQLDESDRGRICTRLNEKLEGRLTFAIELCDEIELTARGKTTYVDQRIDVAELREVAS